MHFEQFHTTPELKEQLRAIGGPIAPWDGCAEFWMEDVANFKKLRESPDFLRIVKRKFETKSPLLDWVKD